MKTEKMTAEQAVRFDTFSPTNALIVASSLTCGCSPYQDVFTYRRWAAQNCQVQKGEHGIKITTWIIARGKDADREPNAEPADQENGYKFPRTTTVFCRCQVRPIVEH